MAFSTVTVFVTFLAFISIASAHGFVTKITVLGDNNKDYPGFDPSTPKEVPPGLDVAWSTSASDQGYMSSSNASYHSKDFICHRNAKPAPDAAQVHAGDKVQLHWTQWPGPEDHQGPILDYLASCNGPCSNVEKASLKWTKIDEAGRFPNGTWATDLLRNGGNTWNVTIPSDLAPGEYVLRNEIIALHSARNMGGAQHYMQCVNLNVTGTGHRELQGVSAAEFYNPTDPGILINVWQTQSLSSYHIPGPTLLAADTGNDGGHSASSTLATVTSRRLSTPSDAMPGNGSYGAISPPLKPAKGFHPVCNARFRHGSTFTLTTLVAPPART